MASDAFTGLRPLADIYQPASPPRTEHGETIKVSVDPVVEVITIDGKRLLWPTAAPRQIHVRYPQPAPASYDLPHVRPPTPTPAAEPVRLAWDGRDWRPAGSPGMIERAPTTLPGWIVQTDDPARGYTSPIVTVTSVAAEREISTFHTLRKELPSAKELTALAPGTARLLELMSERIAKLETVLRMGLPQGLRAIEIPDPALTAPVEDRIALAALARLENEIRWLRANLLGEVALLHRGVQELHDEVRRGQSLWRRGTDALAGEVAIEVIKEVLPPGVRAIVQIVHRILQRGG